jgi:hypothetical protein
VAEQAQGTSRIYHLQAEGMHAIQDYLERVWGDAAAVNPSNNKGGPSWPLAPRTTRGS